MTSLENEKPSMGKISMDEIRDTIESLSSIENKIAGSEAVKRAVNYLRKLIAA